MGEALGPSTQRLCGLPYHGTNGIMGTTGRTIESFLTQFGYTLLPEGPGQYVYSTDAVKCLPLNPPMGHIRPPTRGEVNNCAHWLYEEFLLIQPRVVVLLGLQASRDFYSEIWAVVSLP